MLIEVGNSHYINSDRILAVASLDSMPIRKAAQLAKKEGVLINLTGPFVSKAIIIMDTGVVIKIAIRPSDVQSRILDASPLRS